MLDSVMFWHDQSPGSGVPGPPVHPTRMRRPSGGGAALIVATSKAGLASRPCVYAVAHARNIAIAIVRIAHILPVRRREDCSQITLRQRSILDFMKPTLAFLFIAN